MTRSAVFASACALLLGFGSQALAQGNPLREAYFGETHVHTSWSADAWMFGNRITDPRDAYKYFKGEAIKYPLGYDIKIDTPLDFARRMPCTNLREAKPEDSPAREIPS